MTEKVKSRDEAIAEFLSVINIRIKALQEEINAAKENFNDQKSTSLQQAIYADAISAITQRIEELNYIRKGLEQAAQNLWNARDSEILELKAHLADANAKIKKNAEQPVTCLRCQLDVKKKHLPKAKGG